MKVLLLLREIRSNGTAYYVEDYSLSAFYLAWESERIMVIFDRYLPMRFRKISIPCMADVINFAGVYNHVNKSNEINTATLS